MKFPLTIEVDAIDNGKISQSYESICTVYLDAIDYGLKKLIMEDDAIVVNEASQTESNGHGAGWVKQIIRRRRING